jgi:Domain of unknown function (DUF4126)
MQAALVEWLPALALAIALAACTGLRAWLPLLMASALARLGALELGPSFQFLASNRALVLFSAATLIELLGDKFPVVDHALDLISTLVRPAAGALLAAAVIGRVSDPLTALVLGVAVGAPSSFVPHAAKSLTRAASSTLTAGLANPVLSVVEDLATVALFALALALPFFVAGGVLLLAGLLLRRVARRRALATPA